ncbi:5905_t:CDS:2 [Ambispora gerdemannii]|uniref:Peptide hydrolase n=1 Tax=Ambispora gerdemannii TaxID=144530 RepID=A0A9N8ZD35_9GLOM|nr:5905_t:CDS:2 [Ambispora gerdemannii]
MNLYNFLLIFIFVGDIIAYTTFSEEKLLALIDLDTPNNTYNEFLKPLLVKRVPGTEEHVKVQEFIVNHFIKLDWHVERDNFTSVTPIGEKSFSNIIVTKDITANKRLVLAAHYDSKYFEPPNDNFIGATDSAFPCALLLDLAYSLNDLLSDQAKMVTLQIIFFDGEEAFRDWTDTDSLYGSRHLSRKWEETFITRTDYHQHPSTSLLDGIEALVLLDLLGAKDPKITNYFPTTSWLYKNIALIEEQLWKQSLLHENEDDLDKDFIFDSSQGNLDVFQNIISDDHVPFMTKGVPIVHVITAPFPSVWHKLDDNEKALDPDVMYNLNLIFRIFVAEYFDLDPLSAKNNVTKDV